MPVAFGAVDQDGKADQMQAEAAIGNWGGFAHAIDPAFFEKAVWKGKIEAGDAPPGKNGNWGGVDADKLGSGREGHEVTVVGID